MSSKGFRERILELDQDSVAVSNTTTQSSILPTPHKTAAFPIGYFDKVRVISFCFSGRITIPASSNTLALAIRLGSTDILSGGAMSMNANAKTNVHWCFEGELVNRTFGQTTVTTFFPKGCRFISEAVVGSSAPTAGGHGMVLLPFNAAPNVGTGIDNSTSLTLDVMATWGAAASTYSITTHAGHVDVYS